MDVLIPFVLGFFPNVQQLFNIQVPSIYRVEGPGAGATQAGIQKITKILSPVCNCGSKNKRGVSIDA